MLLLPLGRGADPKKKAQRAIARDPGQHRQNEVAPDPPVHRAPNPRARIGPVQGAETAPRAEEGRREETLRVADRDPRHEVGRGGVLSLVEVMMCREIGRNPVTEAIVALAASGRKRVRRKNETVLVIAEIQPWRPS